ncbi:MAG: enoyl-CoA hydratase/isomerase family protein [Candidatus Lokiarchaeota archaeon]|nr:enoyl-CoA hydratase/isomerase family protein [Candidatus Lokiarchaeota archaeon]
MNFENLIYEVKDKTAFITLNRPNVKNALSMKLSDEIVSAIEIVRKSRNLKFLVIKGAGNNFCVGDDISEMTRWGDANGITRRARYYQNMANQLEELDKITIAAVDGYAVGGGLEITMTCDFVIATERSKWGMPEVDVGITPGWGGTTRLARLIGRRRAKEINLLGALHSGRKAVEWNLWNRLVPDDQLDNEVEKLLEVLKSKNQQGMRQLKFIINRGVECDLYTAQGFEVLSAGLTGAVNGMWKIKDADQGKGVIGFIRKDGLWQTRRRLAKDFWVD